MDGELTSSDGEYLNKKAKILKDFVGCTKSKVYKFVDSPTTIKLTSETFYNEVLNGDYGNYGAD